MYNLDEDQEHLMSQYTKNKKLILTLIILIVKKKTNIYSNYYIQYNNLFIHSFGKYNNV